MKKEDLFIIILLFIALCTNVFGQSTPFPFEVEKTGNGNQSIILIPGFSCSGKVWEETKSKYEKDFTCYTLTMAGFAGAAPQSTITFKYWEDEIARYIQENGIKSPILIGHSMGGGLAMAIAADYPKLIGKIIVVDAVPCLAALMSPSFKSNENNNCDTVVNQMVALSDEQFYTMQKSSIGQMLADTSMHELVVGWSVKSDRKTFAEMYCDFSNTDLREKIKTIKCPSLILLESYFVNIKSNIKDQYKNLKKANLQYANKGLHFIMYDDKEFYFNQLDNFLTQKKNDL